VQFFRVSVPPTSWRGGSKTGRLALAMSYVTQDRHGATTTHYASINSREPVGHGKTWWPDFGPGIRDHSYQEKYMPHHHIFEHQVVPITTGKSRGVPLLERQPAQFRHPAPARESMMMKEYPTNEGRLAAKAVTAKQGALRSMEVRQRIMDSWIEEAPIRMKAASSSQGRLKGSQSQPTLGSHVGVQATRATYEKLGFLVGKSPGNTADGFSGALGASRRHNSLSLNALMFSGNVVDGSLATRSSSRSVLPKKPSKQWKLSPESNYVFDPRTSLPVPRGGWNSQPPTSWPEPPAAGGREWAAPVTFDSRPKHASMEAITSSEWPKSPSAFDRGVTAGSATASLSKSPYGTVREPGQERQGLGPEALQATANLGNS